MIEINSPNNEGTLQLPFHSMDQAIYMIEFLLRSFGSGWSTQRTSDTEANIQVGHNIINLREEELPQDFPGSYLEAHFGVNDPAHVYPY